MQIRDFLNNNPRVATITVIVVLLITLTIIFRSNNRQTGPKISDGEYFWDLNKHELIVASLGDVPPVNTDVEGNQVDGVRAIIWSCGRCIPAEWQVAWVETYKPDVKQKILEAREIPMSEMFGAGVLPPDSGFLNDKWVAVIDSDNPSQELKWIHYGNRRAKKITEAPECPGDKRAKRCIPGLSK